MEEVVDDAQLAGPVELVVHILAEGEVEYAEAEGGEHDRLGRRHRDPPGDHIVEGAVHEVAVAGELLGQVRRGVGPQAVLDVIDNVGRGEHDLGR